MWFLGNQSLFNDLKGEMPECKNLKSTSKHTADKFSASQSSHPSILWKKNYIWGDCKIST